MRNLLELASRVAAHDTTVLITGESGTGKEVLARAIHRMSKRAAGPFVAINCAAIPEQLLESELFGHARGAFTGATGERAGLFEEATDGTLLLDEIGDLPAGLQAKLLRVLEEREVRRVGESKSRPVNARLIAATARRLEDARAAGEFRDDLYYRLNVVELEVPPLRDRAEDVPALLAHFAQHTAKRLGHAISFSPQALSYLSRYPWPGNVRELRNAVERAAVLTESGRLERESFVLAAPNGLPGNGHGGAHGGNGNGLSTDHAPVPGGLVLKGRVEALERDLVQQALHASGGSRREAADLLGVSLRTLFYKLRRYRLE
jgi:DNA-binding NtrC family response regulator